MIFELEWSKANWSHGEQKFTQMGKSLPASLEERDIEGKPRGDCRQGTGGYSKFLAMGLHSPDALLSDSLSWIWVNATVPLEYHRLACQPKSRTPLC